MLQPGDVAVVLNTCLFLPFTAMLSDCVNGEIVAGCTVRACSLPRRGIRISMRTLMGFPEGSFSDDAAPIAAGAPASGTGAAGSMWLAPAQPAKRLAAATKASERVKV